MSREHRRTIGNIIGLILYALIYWGTLHLGQPDDAPQWHGEYDVR